MSKARLKAGWFRHGDKGGKVRILGQEPGIFNLSSTDTPPGRERRTGPQAKWHAQPIG